MTESETHLACCYCNRLNMFLFFPFRHKNIIYSKRNNFALLWYFGNSVCVLLLLLLFVYILVFFRVFACGPFSYLGHASVAKA